MPTKKKVMDEAEAGEEEEGIAQPRPDLSLRSSSSPRVGLTVELKYGPRESATDALAQIGKDGYLQACCCGRPD
jgi:hypothetical protein